MGAFWAFPFGLGSHPQSSCLSLLADPYYSHPYPHPQQHSQYSQQPYSQHGATQFAPPHVVAAPAPPPFAPHLYEDPWQSGVWKQQREYETKVARNPVDAAVRERKTAAAEIKLAATAVDVALAASAEAQARATLAALAADLKALDGSGGYPPSLLEPRVSNVVLHQE